MTTKNPRDFAFWHEANTIYEERHEDDDMAERVIQDGYWLGQFEKIRKERDTLRAALKFAVRRHRTSCACQACEVFWGNKRD